MHFPPRSAPAACDVVAVIGVALGLAVAAFTLLAVPVSTVGGL